MCSLLYAVSAKGYWTRSKGSSATLAPTPMPSCGTERSGDRGWGGGGCIDGDCEAVVGAEGGLCGGSGARDVVLLADAGRRVNQAYAGASVGVAVTAAAGSLPR